MMVVSGAPAGIVVVEMMVLPGRVDVEYTVDGAAISVVVEV